VLIPNENCLQFIHEDKCHLCMRFLCRKALNSPFYTQKAGILLISNSLATRDSPA